MKPKYRVKKIIHQDPTWDYYIIEKSYYKIKWDQINAYGDKSLGGVLDTYNTLKEAEDIIKRLQDKTIIGSKICG